MNQWKQWFVLLLLQCLYFISEETIVKTTGREPYVTRICTNDTLNIITLIVCKVRTKRSRGKPCRLLYQHGHDFEYECGSRFTLLTENRTVFLHLTSLTPEDSGNYSCECSHARGTDTVDLIITVEGDKVASSSLTVLSFATAVTALVIVVGVVLGLILKRRYCRHQTRSGPSGCENSCSLDKGEPEDHYTNLQQPASDFYQNVSLMQHQHVNKTKSADTNPNKQETDGRETVHSCEIYENI